MTTWPVVVDDALFVVLLLGTFWILGRDTNG